MNYIFIKVAELFFALSAIILLVAALGIAWRVSARSLKGFYVFIIYCAADMVMLLSIALVIHQPLAVWKVVIGFFCPPPISFIFLFI